MKENKIDKLRGKLKKIDDKFGLKAPYQIVEDWIEEELKSKKSPLTTGIPDFDKDLKNLKGKLGVFAGYGGSKKSLCALNMSCHNSLRENGGKSIYSTMEMSATNLLDRMIDFQFGKVTDGIISNRATDHWRNKLDESNKALIQKALTDSLKDYYSDSILISQEPRMSTDGYRRMIDKALEKNHEIDSLIVDGLSMMAGFGNEVEIYSENSRVLKELANEYNIAIPLICHLSKGADIDTRDVRPFIRGSQKILDNCDYVLMFSLIKDFNNVGEIEKDKGYIRMINKRGSGNVINHIYTFDEDRLLIEPSMLDPLNYSQE